MSVVIVDPLYVFFTIAAVIFAAMGMRTGYDKRGGQKATPFEVCCRGDRMLWWWLAVFYGSDGEAHPDIFVFGDGDDGDVVFGFDVEAEAAGDVVSLAECAGEVVA